MIFVGIEVLVVGAMTGAGLHISSNAAWVIGVGFAPAHPRCGRTR